ncbi:MAG: WXG100 family type VII secretion target [Pseudonocardiaceae bacterium]
MTIQIPEAVQWLVPIVVGTNWPEGDEDALRRLSDAWEQAATAIEQATGEGNAAASAAMGAMQGEAADAFAACWERFVSGDEQFLVTLQQAADQLAGGCADAALNIEYTKLSIIAALLILAAQIAAMIAAAWATFGASTAGVPIAQAATRITVQIAFRELIQQIAINLAINVGVDAAIQGLQVARGDRHSWDVGKTVDAGISGVAAGVAGGGVGLGSRALGQTTSNFGAAALRGAGEGAVAGAGGNALTDLAHGNAPSLQSLGSGAVSGGVGGALDGTTNRHQGLDETSGDARDIPSDGGPNNVNTDDEDYRLPTTLVPQSDIPELDLPDPGRGR